MGIQCEPSDVNHTTKCGCVVGLLHHWCSESLLQMEVCRCVGSSAAKSVNHSSPSPHFVAFQSLFVKLRLAVTRSMLRLRSCPTAEPDEGEGGGARRGGRS